MFIFRIIVHLKFHIQVSFTGALLQYKACQHVNVHTLPRENCTVVTLITLGWLLIMCVGRKLQLYNVIRWHVLFPLFTGE